MLVTDFQIPRAALIWILLSVILVMAPQSMRMPLWITAIAGACIIWRILVHMGKLDYPGRLLRTLAVLFTLLVSVTQIQNIGVGLDSAASLLTLGFVFKLIEMREKRDIYVVISLCFVMTLITFIYSQSAATSLYVLFSLAVIVGAMVALNRSGQQEGARGTFNMAWKITLQAVPLTVVLFLLFPRIDPLWAVPMPTGKSKTGVSDEMSPGDISALARSTELAFRAKFSSTSPTHADLYWRGLVLDEFDGTTWRRGPTRLVNNSGIESLKSVTNIAGNPSSYNIILESTQQPWLFALHLAEPQSSNIQRGRNFELFSEGLINQRYSYDLVSIPEFQTDLQLAPELRQRNLSIPQQGNQESRDMALQMRRAASSDRNYINQLLAKFSNEEFYYSLNPPLLGENRVDDFLFKSREGFCEHYASSFTYLMRAAGIPARVVTGYQGAEFNFFENYLMVYQYNAHAWAEVWLEGEGWVRFDPTAAVSPERISLGVEQALRDDPAFLQESLFAGMRRGNGNWMNTLRLRLDAIEYEWNRRVVNYNDDTQFEIFERLFGEVTDQKILLVLLLLTSAAIGLVALTVIRTGSVKSHDPVTRIYLSVCKDLERLGIKRRNGEGPVAYCDRVCSENPEFKTKLKPELKLAFQQLTRQFVNLAYDNAGATRPDQTSSGDHATSAETIRNFKKIRNKFKYQLVRR